MNDSLVFDGIHVSEAIQKDYYCERAYFPASPNQKMHAHPMLQYTLVLRGEIKYEIDGEYHPVGEGSGFFVNYDRLHAVSLSPSASGAEFFSLLVSPQFLGGDRDSEISKEFVLPYLSPTTAVDFLPLQRSNSACVPLLDKLYELDLINSRRSYGYQLSMLSFSIALWRDTMMLLRSLNRDELIHEDSPDRVRINRLVHFIHMYYFSKLSLSDLAGYVNISEGECCRLFKRVLNCTPVEFINRYRITQSKRMLVDTQNSILQISQDVGFPSVNHYITMFKRYMGTTPNAYRKDNSFSGELPPVL